MESHIPPHSVPTCRYFSTTRDLTTTPDHIVTYLFNPLTTLPCTIESFAIKPFYGKGRLHAPIFLGLQLAIGASRRKKIF